MANKDLFKSASKVQPANTVNFAGGSAYELSSKQALAQIAATNTFNGTYYASGDKCLQLAKEAVAKCDPEFIAKTAVYARDKAYMKDMPAFLVAHLMARGENALVEKIFPQVINNGKMLRNVFQIARSGQAGKVINFSANFKRKLIQGWFDRSTPDYIYRASIGNDPQLTDIVRASRTKLEGPKNELVKYLMGRPYENGSLPEIVQSLEEFKKNPGGTPPNVDFRILSSLPLTEDHWKEIARNAHWTMARMNLNTFARHNVFKDQELVQLIADKLRNPEEIKRAKVFPYQLMVAYISTSDVPTEISEALQDAMEIAVDNVPALNGNIIIPIDTSGSMSSPITGYRNGAISKVRCVDVAALFGAAILRKNKGARLLPFDTHVRVGLGSSHNTFNPRDSVITNASKLAKYGGGGTDCSCALHAINQSKEKVDAVIMISDNESWSGYRGYRQGTPLANEWEILKRRNNGAKLCLIDLVPSEDSQITPNKDVLCIGGFSDTVFDVVSSFLEGGTDDHWVKVIEAVEI